MWSQAPTERQLRYKEKVTELRRKRNSGLNKEQKERYLVSGWERNLVCAISLLCLLFHIRPSSTSFPYYILKGFFPSPPPLPGAPSEPRSKQGAAAGEHHQWLRPRAVQESAGTCLGRPCKRENSSSPPPLTLFSSPLFFALPPFLHYSSSSLFQSANPPLQPQEESEIFLVVWTITSCYSVFGFSSALLLCDPFRWEGSIIFNQAYFKWSHRWFCMF